MPRSGNDRAAPYSTHAARADPGHALRSPRVQHKPLAPTRAARERARSAPSLEARAWSWPRRRGAVLAVRARTVLACWRPCVHDCNLTRARAGGQVGGGDHLDALDGIACIRSYVVRRGDGRLEFVEQANEPLIVTGIHTVRG